MRFGPGNLDRNLTKGSWPRLNNHHAQIPAADNGRPFAAKQSADGAVALGPSLAAQDNFHIADITLRLCAQHARDRVDLRDQAGLMGTKLPITMRKEVLTSTATAGIAHLLIIFWIEDNLDWTSHSPPRLQWIWRRGRADG